MTFLKSGAVGETARLLMPLDMPGPRSMCHVEQANFADVETHLLLRQRKEARLDLNRPRLVYNALRFPMIVYGLVGLAQSSDPSLNLQLRR